MVFNIFYLIFLYINKEHKYDYIKDEFQKKYFILNDKMKECEKLFEEKDKYEESLDPKDICKRLRLTKQIEVLLNYIKSYIDNLEKKYKTEDKSNKIKILKERYKVLKKDKFETIHIKNDILNNFNELINKKEDPGSSSNILRNDINSEEERSLYDEEKKIIDEFKLESVKVDTKVDELGRVVAQLKIEALEIRDQLKGSNVQITKIIPKAVIITEDVKSKTEMVNDYIKEIRKPFNFCCDIILILILLGLICVLISIIKHKYF